MKSSKKNTTEYVKFADLGFRLLVLIGLGTWLGLRLDAWLGNKTPIGAAVGALLAVCGGIYWVIREVTKPKTGG